MSCSVNKRVTWLNILEKQHILYPPGNYTIHIIIQRALKRTEAKKLFFCLVPNFPNSFDVVIFLTWDAYKELIS